MAYEDGKSDKKGLEAIHEEAMELYDLSINADSLNRERQREDIRFVKMLEQWPEDVKRSREDQGRPCLTVDQLNPIVNQVVNDCRLNKPAIKVRPVDSQGDPKTAEIIGGLIKNIEYTSNAEVAYDTAVDYSVSSGRGYMRVVSDYARNDTFDQDLLIKHVPDPLTIVPDVYSTAADSSDWNYAFVLERVTKAEYRRRYGKKEVVNWDAIASLDNDWFGDDCALIAEYWKREEVDAWVIMTSDGKTQKVEEEYAEEDEFAPGEPLIDPLTGQVVVDPMGEIVWRVDPIIVLAVRETKAYKVTQYIVSGKEVLEKVDWPGQYIPIIPVYGKDFFFEGRRYFISLVRPAFDAQRMKNYWRSTSTELVALAPRAPWVGHESAFQGEDAGKWETANSENHAFLSVKDGSQLPQRQPSPTIPAGALQEALNAVDDIKVSTGIFDASLGARSNETSGRAIMARQREGDVSTFNFIDNLNRGIRWLGVILVDLIPHFYTNERVDRVMNEDGDLESVTFVSPEQMQQVMERAQQAQQDIEGIYAPGLGKYDVAIEAGSNFTTQREEANQFFVELMRALPQYADIIAPFALKTFDAPGVTDLVKEIEERMTQAQQQAGQPAQPTPADMLKLEEVKIKAAEAQAKNEQAMRDYELKAEEARIRAYEAETKRMETMTKAREPSRSPEFRA